MTPKKDESILRLLYRLGLAARGWTICDHWDADLCAIGIASQSSTSRLVYVSTFDKPDGVYDYQCEQARLAMNTEAAYEIVDEGQNVTFHQLVEAMERHLNEHSHESG